MKKSKVLQLNNDYIQSQQSQLQRKQAEERQKKRFMGSILILVVFLFVLPTYNLVQTYHTLKDKEQQLVELEKQYEKLAADEKIESSLVTKLKDSDFAAKYVRAKYQFSKEGEFVYNIPGLLPK